MASLGNPQRPEAAVANTVKESSSGSSGTSSDRPGVFDTFSGDSFAFQGSLNCEPRGRWCWRAVKLIRTEQQSLFKDSLLTGRPNVSGQPDIAGVHDRLSPAGDSESNPNKHHLERGDSEILKDEPDDAEFRRIRRRITNRESAKRMRIKRQEELANIQKELKRVHLENEELRKYTVQLQKQHLALTKDVQHWQGKYTSSKVEVDRLFQQLQQVVALSAVFNPTILEALERTPASSDCTQHPVMEALVEVLPHARPLSDQLEELRKMGEKANLRTAPAPSFNAGSSQASLVGGTSAPVSIPTAAPLSASGLAAMRLVASAHAELSAGAATSFKQGAGDPAAASELHHPTPRRAAADPPIKANASAGRAANDNQQHASAEQAASKSLKDLRSVGAKWRPTQARTAVTS